jgi:hypothetical protein
LDGIGGDLNFYQAITYLKPVEKTAILEIMITLQDGTKIGVLESTIDPFVSGTPDTTTNLIKNSFGGITLQSKNREGGFYAPNTLTFEIIKPDGLYDFTGATIDAYIQITQDPRKYGNTTPYSQTYKFNCIWFVEYDGVIKIECQDFLSYSIKEKKFPNTPLIRDLFQESSINSPLKTKFREDEYCVPVIYGTAYIPLRPVLVNTGTEQTPEYDRFYVLGPTANSEAYNIFKVRSPEEWEGKSTWDIADFTCNFVESQGYLLFQPIIADSDGDGVYDAPGTWSGNGKIYDMPTLFSSSRSATLRDPIDIVVDVLKRSGVDESFIDSTSISAAKSRLIAMGLSSVDWGFRFREDASKVLTDLCTVRHRRDNKLFIAYFSN